MQKKRQEYHMQIRKATKRNSSDITKISCLDTLLFQSMINQLPQSINQITQYLLNNNKQILFVLKNNLDKVIHKTIGGGYNRYTSLNYICHEVSLLFQQPQISNKVLNSLVEYGCSVLQQFGRDLVIKPILNTLFINLRYLNQISQTNFKITIDIINSVIENRQTEIDEFKLCQDILHRGLSLLYQENLSESQKLVLKKMIEIVIFQNTNTFPILCKYLSDCQNNVIVQQCLDIMINLTSLFKKQNLFEIFNSCAIEVGIYSCLNINQSCQINAKAIQLMRNCIIIKPELSSKLKDMGIINILFRMMTKSTALLIESLEFLQIYLIDTQEHLLVKHFITISGIQKLLISIEQNYCFLPSNITLTGLEMLIFLINQYSQMSTQLIYQYIKVFTTIHQNIVDQNIAIFCSNYLQKFKNVFEQKQ